MQFFRFSHFQTDSDKHAQHLHASNGNQTRLRNNIVRRPIDAYEHYATKDEKGYCAQEIPTDKRFKELIRILIQTMRMNTDASHDRLIVFKHFEFWHFFSLSTGL